MNSLKLRLDHVWETPDFASFFKEFPKNSIRKIKKGDTLFYQSDETSKIIYLKSGFVKLYQTTEDGHEPVVYLYGPQSVLGLRALTSKEHTYWHTSEALTDCEIIIISAEDYKEKLAGEPEHIVDLLYLFIQRLNYTERRLYGFIAAETTTRVAAFLYDCALRYGVAQKDEILIPIPLTHQVISEFVGAARESVTISFNKLIKDGVMEHARGQMIVKNMEKLQKKAQIS